MKTTILINQIPTSISARENKQIIVDFLTQHGFKVNPKKFLENGTDYNKYMALSINIEGIDFDVKYIRSIKINDVSKFKLELFQESVSLPIGVDLSSRQVTIFKNKLQNIIEDRKKVLVYFELRNNITKQIKERIIMASADIALSFNMDIQEPFMEVHVDTSNNTAAISASIYTPKGMANLTCLYNMANNQVSKVGIKFKPLELPLFDGNNQETLKTMTKEYSDDINSMITVSEYFLSQIKLYLSKPISF